MQRKEDQVKNAISAFIYIINLFIIQVCQSGSVGLGGPGCQCGPGGQGCPGGQGGPGGQVCHCIWFTWSKQSDYRDNLRCHVCDTLTSRPTWERSAEFR